MSSRRSRNGDFLRTQGLMRNYSSVEGHVDEVLKLFKEEEALGWMQEFTDDEADRKRTRAEERQAGRSKGKKRSHMKTSAEVPTGESVELLSPGQEAAAPLAPADMAP